MIKIILVSALAVCAFGMELPAGLGSMLGNMGGIGNLLGNLGNIDMNQIGGLLKDLKPEDIEKAIGNMPPQMMEMVSGLGFSKEQLKNAMEHLPEHMDELKEAVGNMEGGEGIQSMMMKQLSEGLGVPEDTDMGFVLDIVKEQAKEMLNEMDIDLDKLDITKLLPIIIESVKEEIKESGIELDLDQPGKLKDQLRKMLYSNFDLKEDADQDEVKDKVMGKLQEIMSEQMGEKVDITKPDEAMPKLFNKLREEGLDIADDADLNDIKDALLNKLKDAGFDFTNGDILQNGMKFASALFNGMTNRMQEGPAQHMPEQMMMMMQPQMQQQPPMPMPFNLNLEINVDGGSHPTNVGVRRPGSPAMFPAYLRGAEQALISSYGNDDDVVRHVMNAHQGISSGMITEAAVEELLRDLMNYRMKARVLMAKNQMLEQELMKVQMAGPMPQPMPQPMPVPEPSMLESPLIKRIISKCRHHLKQQALANTEAEEETKEE